MNPVSIISLYPDPRFISLSRHDNRSYRSSPLEALRIPEFRSLVIGRFIFIMGLRMMSTLVGWWIYNLTNAPIAIGIVGLSEFIPAVSLALYAGHVIDISEKRKLMLTGVGLYALAAFLLLILSIPAGTNHLNPHVIALLHLPDHFRNRYRPIFYRSDFQCDAGADRSKNNIAKCDYLEHGRFSFSLHYRTRPGWIS